MAIVLIRKMGRPRSSNPYGITDPNGNPGCLRERVERLPMRPKYTKVRARWANEGSGTAGWSLAAPVPPCFLMDEEDNAAPSGSLNNPFRVVHEDLHQRASTESRDSGNTTIRRLKPGVHNHFVAAQRIGL